MKNKIKNVFACALSAAILTTSCTSSNQAIAGLTGAAIGSNIGGAIGAASSSGYGHFRHHYNGQGAALGSLIGMGVGAALGVAIQKSAEDSERTYYESQTSSSYNIPESYGGSYTTPAPAYSLPLRISELTYFDGNGDGYLSKGETVELETYIQNTSNHTLYNVQIALGTQGSKYVTVSSPLTITLEPKQKVRYSGRIYAKRSRSGSYVPVSINIAVGNNMAQSETLYLEMR